MDLLPFNIIRAELISAFFRILTGRLFTESQIREITSHTIGRYFAELFPEPAAERRARERVEEAREHITEASNIITAMKTDLESQTAQLDKLLHEIEEKKNMAERYERLSTTNQESWNAFRKEMEDALRKELFVHSEQGKTMRRVGSFVFWFVTLVLGAALGAYFTDIVAWVKNVIA